jgi:hypothetical protein
MTPPLGNHTEPSSRERIARLEVRVQTQEEENSGQTRRIEVLDAKVDALRISVGRIEFLSGIALKLMIAVLATGIAAVGTAVWRAVKASL